MKRIKGIDKVMSLFELKHIKSKGGAMVVNPAVKQIPGNEAGRLILRDEIRENDIVYGNVISKDFKVTAVIGMVESGTSDKLLLAEIEKLIQDNPGNEEVFIGGKGDVQ